MKYVKQDKPDKSAVKLDQCDQMKLPCNEDSASSDVNMRVFSTREIEDYPPILQACHVMEITGFSNGKTYELMRSKDCPTVKCGKRMIVPRDLFWQFLLNEATKGGADA